MIKTPIVLLKFTKSVHLVRFLKKMNQIGCIPMLKLNAHIYEGSIRQECGSEEQPWETETLSDYVLI